MVAHARNLAAQEAEAGGSQVQSQPQQQPGAKQLSETLSLNKIQNKTRNVVQGLMPLSSIPSNSLPKKP